MGSIPGAHTGDGRFDGETFLGVLLIFFLGGRGRGRGAPGCVLLRVFLQDERAPNSPVCVIYYMLNSGGFVATCLQTIAKGGSSILGRPGQTCAMFQASTVRRPVHTLTTTLSLFACYMSSSEPSSEAVVVFGCIEGPFLVSRTGCTRELHAPCIKGPFLVSKTGHVSERHAP